MSDEKAKVKKDGPRYRKVYVCIWNDEKFHRLSPHGKLAFLFLITHPNTTSLGLIRSSIVGLADELEVLPEAFQEVFQEGLAEVSKEASCIYIKNFIKHQTPQSPNVIIAWAKSIELIPECELKTLAIQDARAFTEGLEKAFRDAFDKAFGKTIGNKGERTKDKGQRTCLKASSHDEAFPVDMSTGEVAA